MKREILEARTDEDGTLGLMLARAPRRYETNSASSGLLLAHDIIEHQNGVERLGEIDDELEALGAIWITRGQFGDLSRNGAGSAYSTETNIASDVTRMGVDVIHGAYFPAEQPRTREHSHDGAFRSIIEIARQDIPKELNSDETLDHDQIAARDRYLGAALHLMRRGARKCARRFPGQFTANSQFWAIAEAVEPFCKPDYEGARYLLDWGNGEAFCRELHE
jgi:hypothetical protein